MTNYYNIKQVAKILHLSELTVRRHIYMGHIKFIKMGREYRILQEEVDRILNCGMPATYKYKLLAAKEK